MNPLFRAVFPAGIRASEARPEWYERANCAPASRVVQAFRASPGKIDHMFE